jgi:hypothetical protein
MSSPAGRPEHVHLGIFKNFKISERCKPQFRGELFHLMNTPQFAAPNTSLGSPLSGQVTATAFQGPRQVQLGLKLSFQGPQAVLSPKSGARD